MALIAKQGGSTSIPPLDEGIYTGICTWLIDLGEQINKQFNKISHKVMLMWDIAGETITINGEELNRTVNKEYSLSLHEKSGLRKDLQSWRGKAFTPEELDGFNLVNILGKPCQIQIIHEEKDGRKYARIGGIMAMSKGMPMPEGDYSVHIFDFEEEATWANFNSLPEWIQTKIREAENYKKSQLASYIDMEEGFKPIEDDDEELPF